MEATSNSVMVCCWFSCVCIGRAAVWVSSSAAAGQSGGLRVIFCQTNQIPSHAFKSENLHMRYHCCREMECKCMYV